LAFLRVRYRTGDTDEWTIPELVNLDDLHSKLHRGLKNQAMVGFATTAESGEETDFGYAWVRMREVTMFHVDGFVDFERIASHWEPTTDDPEGLGPS
jgi:hypothetical protein